MVLALGVCTPLDLSSEFKGTLYGVEGIAPGYVEGRRPWEDVAGSADAGEGDVAGTLGSAFREDERFPSLVDLFLRHGGSLEVVQELIRGIKARTKEELEHWGPEKICL